MGVNSWFVWTLYTGGSKGRYVDVMFSELEQNLYMLNDSQLFESISFMQLYYVRLLVLYLRKVYGLFKTLKLYQRGIISFGY